MARPDPYTPVPLRKEDRSKLLRDAREAQEVERVAVCRNLRGPVSAKQYVANGRKRPTSRNTSTGRLMSGAVCSANLLGPEMCFPSSFASVFAEPEKGPSRGFLRARDFLLILGIVLGHNKLKAIAGRHRGKLCEMG